MAYSRFYGSDARRRDLENEIKQMYREAWTVDDIMDDRASGATRFPGTSRSSRAVREAGFSDRRSCGRIDGRGRRLPAQPARRWPPAWRARASAPCPRRMIALASSSRSRLRARPQSRQTVDRSPHRITTSKAIAYVSELSLSEGRAHLRQIGETPEGFVICRRCVLGRSGHQPTTSVNFHRRKPPILEWISATRTRRWMCTDRPKRFSKNPRWHREWKAICLESSGWRAVRRSIQRG